MTDCVALSKIWRVLLAGALVALAACAPQQDLSTRDDVFGLTQALIQLDPNVDPSEAARAARIAYSYTEQLVVEYQIVDPPLVHNTKVNMGLKPRGLCWHWAEDIQIRLEQEQFQTLAIHRAIAEHPFRIDHSTAIVSAKGDVFTQGIVIDPWRYGGVMHWVPVADDARYAWRDQRVVLNERRKARLVAAQNP